MIFVWYASPLATLSPKLLCMSGTECHSVPLSAAQCRSVPPCLFAEFLENRDFIWENKYFLARGLTAAVLSASASYLTGATKHHGKTGTEKVEFHAQRKEITPVIGTWETHVLQRFPSDLAGYFGELMAL